ncbi:MAG: adenylate/guanylate cyclase domain-containing protein [bacterium]|nr:adenylate/guanylate cyclase domain-containing protein [bacterium]
MQTPRTQFRHTEDLLLDREIAALRLVILFRLVFCLATLISTLAIGKSTGERVTTSILTMIALASTLPFWLSLNRRKNVKLIGMSGVLFDVSFLMVLPFIWFVSVGGPENVSPAFMLKHPNLISLSYMLLIAHNLAGRPRYPLILIAGVTTGGLAILGYCLNDPRVIFSPNFVSHILGETVSLEFWIMNKIAFVAVGLLLGWHARQTNRGIRKAVRQETENLLLSRYFSPAVQQEILNQNPAGASGERALLGEHGSRKNIAVMFSDLRGFTAMAETLPPEDAMRWLREYHEAMVTIIFKHGGTLDKFLGDGILATFGTPEAADDCAERAVRAGLEMRAAIVGLNQRRRERGLPDLAQGIGIHFGPAIVGNVGVPERLEYTVIGDTVNLASRIESLCKELRADLLISGSVARELADNSAPAELRDAFESVGPHDIRGRRQPVLLLRPRG